MYHVDGITLHALYYAREVAERAAYPHELHVGVELLEPGDFLKLLVNVGFDLLRLLLGFKPGVVEQVAERNGAERQVFAVEKIAAVVVNELQTAAADVHDDGFRDVKRVNYAVVDMSSLFFLGEYLELKAADGVDFFDKAALVLRPSHRVGCERVNLVDVVAVAKFSEHFERFDGLRHARGL